MTAWANRFFNNLIATVLVIALVGGGGWLWWKANTGLWAYFQPIDKSIYCGADIRRVRNKLDDRQTRAILTSVIGAAIIVFAGGMAATPKTGYTGYIRPKMSTTFRRSTPSIKRRRRKRRGTR